MTPEREAQLREVAAGGRMWPLYADVRAGLREVLDELDVVRVQRDNWKDSCLRLNRETFLAMETARRER